MALLLSGILSLAAFLVSLYRVLNLNMQSPGGKAPLSYHYSLYIPDTRNSFFNGIIEGARRAAAELDAAVSIHSVAPEKDELEMAAYTGVDGAIVCPYIDDNLARRQLEKLKPARVPVVLISHNLSGDVPWTFIGANNYDMGRRIGYFAGALAAGEEAGGQAEGVKLAVVYSDKAPGIYAERELVEMGISAALGNRLLPPITGFKTNLNPLDAEALMYRLFQGLGSGEEPDFNIIVFTDPSDTIAAAQTLVDMNLVGRMRLVGFGSEPAVLENIRKEIISFSVSIDSERIGYEAVRSLYALSTTGYTSTSIDTGIDIITGSSLGGR
jgi:ribose transport system substrate-binding protein